MTRPPKGIFTQHNGIYFTEAAQWEHAGKPDPKTGKTDENHTVVRENRDRDNDLTMIVVKFSSGAVAHIFND